MSDAQLQKRVFEYAGELSGGLNLTPHPISLDVWYSKLPDRSTVNVRNVSTSQAGRCTLELKNSPNLKSLGKIFRDVEIKFK